MRVIAVFMAFSLLVSFGCKGTAPAGDKAWVDVQDVLNVRAAADKNAAIVTTLSAGTEVEVLSTTGADMTIGGKTGKWTNIKAGTVTGWVFGGFLSKKKSGTGLEKYAALGTYIDEEIFAKHGKNYDKASDGNNTLPVWTFTNDMITYAIYGPDGETIKLKIVKIDTPPGAVVVYYDGQFMANGAEGETYFKGSVTLHSEKEKLTLTPVTDLRQWKAGQSIVLIKVK